MRTCSCSVEHDFKLTVFFLSIVSVRGLHRSGPQLAECVGRQTGGLALRCAAADDTWRDGCFTPLPTHPRHCLQLRSPFTALGFCFCHTIHGNPHPPPSTDLSVNTGCCGSLLPSYCQWRPPPPPHLPTRPCPMFFCYIGHSGFLLHRPLWVSVTWATLGLCYIGHSGFLLPAPP